MKLGFVVSACVAWMAACGMDNAGRTPDAAQKQKLEETGLVTHSILPNVTDPAIDQALDDHLTWIDRDARTNHKLFVYMPGTGSIPARHLLVQREAARLGYHVIGLMYANSVGLAAVCPRTADPNACFENARLEVLDGVDRTPVVNVNRANSIDNRLTKLLRYLDQQFPEEGWSRFSCARRAEVVADRRHGTLPGRWPGGDDRQAAGRRSRGDVLRRPRQRSRIGCSHLGGGARDTVGTVLGTGA
jgi:hypothetical protein